ncbi:MAG: phage major capsid protein [Atopobiaceae bacterium]|jgi:HK97 family phage major capsid protein|nr:phage major capsid protein [Atopobiaceae bacterium]
MLKALLEKRAGLIARMKEIKDQAIGEERAFSEEEDKKFSEIEAQVRSIDSTIDSIKRGEDLANTTIEDVADTSSRSQTTDEETETRAFADYIRSQVTGTQLRADSNITKTDNGAIIPKTIANKIIDTVKDLSPLFGFAEKFPVKGNLSIPYVDSANDNITVAYATEFTELEAKSAKLASVDLSGYLAGALAKISRSLINASDFDLTSFVVDKIAMAVADWLDHEIIVGTDGKIEGLRGVKIVVTTASADAITFDEIIETKDKVKSKYQGRACWVMNQDTLTKIRLLKDGNGRYLVNDDVTSEFGTTLLGKPVYTSDNCSKLAAGASVIFYGDFSQGLAAKLVEDQSIQILVEKYATQHAIGVVAWEEADCKVQDAQAIASLVVKAA